jgi:hypothetical protein
MTARVALGLDVGGAEILLGGERVVGGATQREVLGGVPTAPGERHEVVELESVGFAATLSGAVDVRAARAVAVEDGTANAGRNVAGPARPARGALGLGLELGLGLGLGFGLERRRS